MRLKEIFVLIAILSLTGCSGTNSSSQSPSELAALISHAKMEAAAGQPQDAEKKLLDCIHQADKNSLEKLAALNELIDVEIQLKNDSRAKGLIKEAGVHAEEFCRTDMQNCSDPRMFAEARRALFRWADAYTEVGSFESARTLYRKAQILEQRMGAALPQEADLRLRKLDEQITSEKHAIEHEDGLLEKDDPRHISRVKRTAARRRIMDESKRLNLEMMHKPSKATADKLLKLLPEVRTAFGIREGEYRASLGHTSKYIFAYSDREKAVAMLKDDMANFANISQSGIDKTDPTTLENAQFTIADLGQLAGMIAQRGDRKEAERLARKGIDLAQRVQSPDTLAYADCLKEVSIQLEKRNCRAEAMPFRMRQIAMLERLKLTDNYSDYYEAKLELARTMQLTGQKQEALPLYDYAISRLLAIQPNNTVIAYAYACKAECLCDLGEYSSARKSIVEAKKIVDKIGDPPQKFHCHLVFCIIANQLDDAKEARKMGELALKYAEQAKPPARDRAVADVCRKLSEIETNAGNFAKARTYGLRAVENQIKCAGENNSMTAGYLNNLAAIEHNLGNLKETEKLRLRSLNICKTVNAPDKIALTSTLLQLANFYHVTGQTEKAIPCYRQVLATGKGNTSADFIQFHRMARVQLAQVLVGKHPEEARRLKNEAVAGGLDLSNGRPADDCNYYLSMGDICTVLKDFKNAELLYDKVQQIVDKDAAARNLFEDVVKNRKKGLYKVTNREKL